MGDEGRGERLLGLAVRELAEVEGFFEVADFLGGGVEGLLVHA